MAHQQKHKNTAPNEQFNPVVTSNNGKIIVIGGSWKWGPLFGQQNSRNHQTA